MATLTWLLARPWLVALLCILVVAVCLGVCGLVGLIVYAQVNTHVIYDVPPSMCLALKQHHADAVSQIVGNRPDGCLCSNTTTLSRSPVCYEALRLQRLCTLFCGTQNCISDVVVVAPTFEGCCIAFDDSMIQRYTDALHNFSHRYSKYRAALDAEVSDRRLRASIVMEAYSNVAAAHADANRSYTALMLHGADVAAAGSLMQPPCDLALINYRALVSDYVDITFPKICDWHSHDAASLMKRLYANMQHAYSMLCVDDADSVPLPHNIEWLPIEN